MASRRFFTTSASLLKAPILNLVALSLAALIGAIALSQVADVHEIPVGELQIAPLIRATIVTVIVAAIAPKTGFRAKLLVFIGIQLFELVLSVVTTAAAIKILQTYFDGNREAAMPWLRFGAITPLVSGATGYLTLRQLRRPADKIAGVRNHQ